MKENSDIGTFPVAGNVRSRQAAKYLGIGHSTFLAYVHAGKIPKPIKYGKRLSVWSAKLIRKIAEEGLPLEEGAKND